MNGFPTRLIACLGLLLVAEASLFVQSLHAQANDNVVVGSALISTIHSADVPARETGVLTNVAVREGDRVQQGDLLVKLDPEEAELEVDRAEMEHQIAVEEYENGLRAQFAEKAVEVAQAEVKRAEEANQKFSEAISRTELDRLRLVAQKAEIDHEMAEHEHSLLGKNAQLKRIAIDRARLLLERRLIRAPINGTVVEVAHRQGEWVEPGMTIVRLLDTQWLRAEAVLAGKYRHADLKERRVIISMPQSGQTSRITANGVVTFVHPETDPVDGSFRVFVEFENTDQQFRPGDSATIQIMLD